MLQSSAVAARSGADLAGGDYVQRVGLMPAPNMQANASAAIRLPAIA